VKICFFSKPKKYGLNIAVVTGLQDGIMGLLNLGCLNSEKHHVAKLQGDKNALHLTAVLSVLVLCIRYKMMFLHGLLFF
jgi:hypothetical protein